VFVRLFDRLEALWDGAPARRAVSIALVGTFAATLALIELGRRGLLPARLAEALPRGHFHAVQVAFYLLLAYEVLGLVFGIARSVSNAAGKQFEIFSLILLRQSFESFGHLDEPLAWGQAQGTVLLMLADSAGALLIFVILGFYYRLQRHRPLSTDAKDRASFIAAKKAIALLLLAVFAVAGLRAAVGQAFLGESHQFFEIFYTLLVFADILVVLISLRYSSTYPVVFRNSSLAVSTVLMRVALSAPPFANALLGVAAALFALALTIAYNAFSPRPGRSEPAEAG
jgi:hypothetical protein